MRQPVWPLLGIMIAGAFTLLVTGAIGHAAQQPGRSYDCSIEVAPGGRLTLDLQTGGGVDLQGWDESRVSVRARLRGPGSESTDVLFERVDGGVLLRSRFRSGTTGATAHAFEIRVPRRYDVQLRSAGGGLVLRDLEGTVRGESGGGGIDIERLRGRAELTTGGGRIRVRDSELDGLVTTGGGEISVVNTRGTLRTSSSSAPAREEIDVERQSPPADDSKVVRIRQSGGAISLAEVSNGAELTTGGGDIRIGRASGAIRASTGGGNITIGPLSGSLTAGTGKGNVHVTIARLDAGAPGADIGSGLGAVVVEIAPDVSAALELETAYTNTLGRRTKIDSSWTLVEDETSEWDFTRGTPRKYMRARGQVGNGGALIRVRTVNGDISVRRRAD